MPLDIEAARTALRDLQPKDAETLRRRVEELAGPRMSGTGGASDIEASLRTAFEGRGYEAEALPFSFSTWPGRFGLPVSGVLLALTGLGGTLLLNGGLPVAALAVLVVGLLLAGVPLFVLGPAMDRLPFGRVESRNLLFTRPGARPAWILMAHRDTKSQPIPTLVRTAALVAGTVGWLALVALAGLWFAGEAFRSPTATLVAGAVVMLAGAAMVLGWASNGSPGALDNATGLAALLEVAGEDAGDEVAFLVTDGEELGLAGARAAAERLPAVQGVINVDGLDDRGAIRIAEGYGSWRRRGSAPQLAAALLASGRALGVEIRRRPLPRSILVDHQPIAAAGVPAVTVLRGEWRSLLRVHRPGDSADRISGHGAAETATVLAAAVRLLRDSERPHLAGGRAPSS